MSGGESADLVQAIDAAARGILIVTAPDELATVLDDWGLLELLDHNEALAVATVFRCAGRLGVAAPLADFVVAHVAGRSSVDQVLFPFGLTADLAVDPEAPYVTFSRAERPLSRIEVERDAFCLVPVRDCRLTAATGLAHGTGVYRLESADRSKRGGTVPLDWDRTTALLRVGVAAELLGLAERVLELSVEHVQLRFLHGEPLSSRQVVRHRLADVRVAVEAADAVLNLVSGDLEASDGDERSDLLPLAVKALAGKAALLACDAALQFFGAIAYTEEHVLHRLLRRAWVLDEFLGSGRAIVTYLGIRLASGAPVPAVASLAREVSP